MSGPERRGFVLVAHAGRQHSDRAAAALADAALLAAYWAGLPPGREVRNAELGARIVSFGWAPLVRRLLERALPGRAREWGDYLANRLFDRRASARLPGLRPRVVLGYEMACGHLFDRARALGAVTILDAASLHHATQDRWRRPVEPARLGARIRATKDRELALADHLVVASALAAESYRAGGYPADRISVVPLGVDRERFRPGRGGGAALRALFVGKLSETKGVDLLLSAWGELARAQPAARLVLAGQGRSPLALPPGVELLRPDGEELVAAFQAADVLVLPSRLDGFGLVVPEALACGTPVVVSDHVGAQDLVVEGVNGWVVPAGNAAALGARLLACAADPGHVRALREACVESVRGVTWETYARRLVAVVERLLAENAS